MLWHNAPSAPGAAMVVPAGDLRAACDVHLHNLESRRSVGGHSKGPAYVRAHLPG
ncbi:uncharacterized protein SOCEGT47_048370 [Sorangium cellulosum]|uniref:Uncharacterized protein n=1 Tax=Sorangium cellulosum TaxID=56 RepID=A0A4P2Q4K5_SORCE|nr:uncharacterized protein SOCEGT47_048370 [Sorangium cellulosum]